MFSFLLLSKQPVATAMAEQRRPRAEQYSTINQKTVRRYKAQTSKGKQKEKGDKGLGTGVIKPRRMLRAARQWPHPRRKSSDDSIASCRTW